MNRLIPALAGTAILLQATNEPFTLHRVFGVVFSNYSLAFLYFISGLGVSVVLLFARYRTR